MSMEEKIPQDIKDLMDKFTQAGYQIYLVGGSVRDLLMNRPVKDWDFTTDAKPEEILKIFPEGFYDNKFGTVGIPVDNQIFEITTMRRESEYKDFRHPAEIVWTNKIEEDLARRDFTINAMALSLQGKLVDPHKGQEDIRNGLIRAVGDPNKRFKEDALRLMRAIRISTELNFTIEENTQQALKENARLISQVAYERIRVELFRILGSDNAYEGIKKLREAGILQIILPEVERTFGVVQQGPKHAREYEIGEHSLLTLLHTPSKDPLVRLAALLHDIGKPDTVATEKDGNVTFYNHDVAGGRLALQVAKRFNLSKKETDKLYRLVRWHLFTVDENQTDSAIRRFIKNVGLENIADMLALRIGDRLGGGTQKAVSWRMEKFQERIEQVLRKPFSVTDLKINGNDVMKVLNIPPGRKVGEILDQLFQEVLEDSSKNDREYLLKRLQEIK